MLIPKEAHLGLHIYIYHVVIQTKHQHANVQGCLQFYPLTQIHRYLYSFILVFLEIISDLLFRPT